MKLMPSLIPFIKMGSNRSKFESLWNNLWLAHMSGRDLNAIAKRFILINPDLKDQVVHLARHFTHVMCLHYDFESPEYLSYEQEVFPPMSYQQRVANELKIIRQSVKKQSEKLQLSNV